MSDTKGIDYNEWGFCKKTLSFKDRDVSMRYQGAAVAPDKSAPDEGGQDDSARYRQLGGVAVGEIAQAESMYRIESGRGGGSYTGGNSVPYGGKIDGVERPEPGERGSGKDTRRGSVPETVSAADIVNASNRKPRIGRGEKMFVLTVIAVCVMVAVSLSILMAQGLNVGHLMGKLTRVDAETSNYYMVVTHTPVDKSAADTAAAEVKLKGGAGYVVSRGGSYMVVAAVYPDMESATVVAKRMEGYTASVHALTAPKVKASFGDKATAEAVTTVLKLWGHSYKVMYDMSIGLDTGETDYSTAVTSLTSLMGYCREQSDTYKAATASQSGNILIIRINAALTELVAGLGTAGLGAENGAALSRAVKYSAAKTVSEYTVLCEELNAA